MSLLVAAFLISTPPGDPMAGAGLTNARVQLSGHRGGIDLEADPPILELNVLARNTLGVPIDRVTVGLLFAADQPALAAYDPAVLYRSPPEPPTDVGAFRREVETLIEPGAEVPLTVEIQLTAGYPSPQVFQTHILSYRLAAATPELLFELINTEVPADELAVVETLALAGDASAKGAAREKWGSDARLVAGLVLRLRQPVEGTADLETTLAWVLAVRALGVVGGPLAVAALQPLLEDPRLPAFDDELQVMRAARAQHSRLEVPLAYAIPPEARRMQDVVAAALSDASGPEMIRVPAAGPDRSEPVAVEPGRRSEAPAVPPWLWGAATGLLVGVAVFVGLRLATRRRSE